MISDHLDQADLGETPDSRRWYVVNTQSTQEYLARRCLMKQAFEVWLPDMTIREGELSIVTGIPDSGKSKLSVHTFGGASAGVENSLRSLAPNRRGANLGGDR